MIFRSSTFDCAVDLGTSKLVVTESSGARFEMPSFVAVSREFGRGSRILAVGSAAKEYHGRTNDSVDVVRPIARGVVANQVLSAELVHHALVKVGLVSKKQAFFARGPRVLVSHPIELSPVEQKAFARSCLDAGASKVSLVAEPLAAGAAVFEDHWSSSSKMIVDFGAGVIEAVAFSGRGILAHSSMRWGSDDIDSDIEKYLQQMHHLIIGPLTAEDIKQRACRIVFTGEPTIDVRGFDLITRKPKRVAITCREIRQLMKPRTDMLVQGIVRAFERIPESAFEEIARRGLVITGGGAWLKGFLDGLETRLNVPVHYDSDPSHSVCRGEFVMMSQPRARVLSLVDSVG
ncbi:MAG TPA: rod shape-determining protein [Bdellovibrionota bacterium]|nr:rod shape-determining protein [Bdellovibrionota bacterium]